HDPTGMRGWRPSEHARFRAVGHPHDGRTGPEDPQLPARRGGLAEADRRRRDRMVAIFRADRGDGPSAGPRNQPREYDAGRSRRDRANLRDQVRASRGGPSVARLWEVRGPDSADDMKIPRSHPRYESLVRRERLVRGWKEGIVVPEGFIAHGRGEAWDYLFGEETSAPGLVAERAAAARLLAASRPVISVNGNVA